MSILSAIILLGVLIFVHELGHFLFAKLSKVKVLRFSLGFGPKVFGIKMGETEYVLSAFPLGGYVKMLGEDPKEDYPLEERSRAFGEQPLKRRALIVLAGPLFNIILSYVIFTGILATGLPLNVPKIEKVLPVVDSVEEGYPAKEAGLRPGDRIVQIEDKRIDTWFDMVDIVSQNPGRELLFVVKRGDETIEVKIVPKADIEVTPEGERITIGRIGVRRDTTGLFQTIEVESPLMAPVVGIVATYRMGFFIIDSIKLLVTGKVSLKNLGGPVTIMKESGRAAEAGFLPYILFMALLSVNLGILNLLPIPILDGGHLLLYAIEAIKGSPLKQNTVVLINRVGYFILALLMGLALYNDFLRILSGR